MIEKYEVLDNQLILLKCVYNEGKMQKDMSQMFFLSCLMFTNLKIFRFNNFPCS